jgi:hypothetical protein
MKEHNEARRAWSGCFVALGCSSCSSGTNLPRTFGVFICTILLIWTVWLHVAVTTTGKQFAEVGTSRTRIAEGARIVVPDGPNVPPAHETSVQRLTYSSLAQVHATCADAVALQQSLLPANVAGVNILSNVHASYLQPDADMPLPYSAVCVIPKCYHYEVIKSQFALQFPAVSRLPYREYILDTRSA